MIEFGLTIDSPIKIEGKTLFYKSGSIPSIANKYYEIQCFRDSVLLEFSVNVAFHTDHAGVHLKFGFLGHLLDINIYDNRHWDDDNNTWVVYK